jgi:DNA polymerase-3 subunit chi
MKIDFYVLNKSEKQADWLFACKLIEKAYEMGHHIFILLDNKEDAFVFDELLWEYEPSSFIPHHIQGEGPKPAPAVQIGFDISQTPEVTDIFINLSLEIPEYFKRFKRICEIVTENEAIKTSKREHYKFYQGHQLKIDTHKLN